MAGCNLPKRVSSNVLDMYICFKVANDLTLVIYGFHHSRYLTIQFIDAQDQDGARYSLGRLFLVVFRRCALHVKWNTKSFSQRPPTYPSLRMRCMVLAMPLRATSLSLAKVRSLLEVEVHYICLLFYPSLH